MASWNDESRHLTTAAELRAEARSRIATLESQLAASEGMVEAWRVRAEAHRQAHEFSEKAAKESERLAVEAVRRRAHIQLSNLQSGVDLVMDDANRVPCDLTDAGILAALRKAAEVEP